MAIAKADTQPSEPAGAEADWALAIRDLVDIHYPEAERTGDAFAYPSAVQVRSGQGEELSVRGCR